MREEKDADLSKQLPCCVVLRGLLARGEGRHALAVGLEHPTQRPLVQAFGPILGRFSTSLPSLTLPL